jgi:choice-of-anchor A domain-containing protein
MPLTEQRTRPRLEVLEDRAAPSSLFSDFAALHPYGVLALSGSKLDITNPQTRVGGAVGLGPHATQNFSDGEIDGNLVLDYTANNSHSNNVRIQGSTVRQDLQAAVNAAIDASDVIAHLHATQQFVTIPRSQTIVRTTHENVIDVGSVQLDGSSVLTLHGSSSDYFLFNVTGKFAMTGDSQIKLTGGIDSTHVLFNVVGTGEAVAFTGKSVAVGTFLADNRDINVSGATVNGVLIGAMDHKIALTSGAQIQVNTPHFDAYGL